MDSESHEIGLPVRREGGGLEMPLSTLSTTELLGEITGKATAIAKMEVELAKNEIRADLKREIRMAGGLGIAGVCAIVTVTLLCVVAAMALSLLMAAWLATLIVAAVVALVGAVAGLWGWSKRVTDPLQHTRKSLKEDVRWAKERMA